MTMVGADVSQLRALGKQFGDTGRLFERTGVDLSAALARSAWTGSDATRFRSEWATRHRPRLGEAGDLLAEAGRALVAEACEQEQASDSGGTLGGGSCGDGSPSDPGAPLDRGGPGEGPADLTGILDHAAVDWGFYGVDVASFLGDAVLDPLAQWYGRAGDLMQSVSLVNALSGATDLDDLPQALAHADELAETGSRLGAAADVLGTVGDVAGGVGMVLDGASLIDNIVDGDGFGAADDVISLGLGAAGFLFTVGTPVGWAVAGAGLLWGGAQLLSGDVPVTERIAGWFR
ncbi:hypothetical protein PCC79_01930 [Propioniciclava soli]|uniref:WXG100 family type VII secretion target n=1 Tax=Propioniciclava soli TaxID=2775081 RepID=A0ABZ3C879_9ACTN